MEHMNKKFPKGNDLLREHKETTLEKNQKKRQDKKTIQELDVANEYNILQKKENQRMKRKAKLEEYFNQFEKDIA